MAKVYYKLSNKVQDNGKSQIIVWLKWSRTFQPQIKSGVYVRSKFFEKHGENGGNTTGEIKVPKKSKLNFADVQEAKTAYNELQEFTNKLLRLCEVTPPDKLCKEYMNENVKLLQYIETSCINTFSLEELKRKAEAEQQRKTFFEYGEMYLNEKKFAYSQVRNFRAMMRCLHRWENYRQMQGERFTIVLDSLNADDITNFRDYLKNESEMQNEYPLIFEELLIKYPVEITTKHRGRIEPRGENTIIKLMKRLKAFCLWLNEKGITANKPFDKVKMGEAVYGVPFYLTLAERNTLADFDMSERPALEAQRDIFIFQCLTGCRVSDLYLLTKANITNNILEYVPVKTKDHKQQVKPRIPLNERALKLISKYEGVDVKGRLFPYISSQKYNDAIKEALRLCGIDRNVPVRNSLTGNTEMKPLYAVASSHMARRTFIGCAYEKVQDPNIIGKMSGHVEGSKAFARYREINDDILKNIINMID